MEMSVLAAGLDYVDLRFLGIARNDRYGRSSRHCRIALIDPGPATTLSTACAAAPKGGFASVTCASSLLTHIHLDHAGRAGGHGPGAPASSRCSVHARGAPHLVDPTKLLASAVTPLYGEDMDRAVGRFPRRCRRPDPSRFRVGRPCSRGSRARGRAYTPGHASRITSASSTCIARGVRRRHRRHSSRVGALRSSADAAARHRSRVWRASAERILAMGSGHAVPDALRSVPGRATAVRRALRTPDRMEPAGSSTPGRRFARRCPASRRFVDAALLDLRRHVGVAEADDYNRAGGLHYSWQGLERYFSR